MMVSMLTLTGSYGLTFTLKAGSDKNVIVGYLPPNPYYFSWS